MSIFSEVSVLGSPNLLRLLCFSCFLVNFHCYGQQILDDSIVISSFHYPQTKLGPFEWRYLRVELPAWFSSVDMTLVSNVDIGKVSLDNHSKSTLPMVCLLHGSPPLPDALPTYLKDLVVSPFNGSIGDMQNLQGATQCFFFRENVTLLLTNEQISSGVWYLGFFNGIGPVRTQSKMINQGPSYMFGADISVKGCITSAVGGPYCNQTIDALTCSPDVNMPSRSLLDLGIYNVRDNFNHEMSTEDYLLIDSSLSHEGSSKVYAHRGHVVLFNEEKISASNETSLIKASNFVTCKSSLEAACIENGETKIYTLEVVDPPFELKIMATEVRFNQTSRANNTGNISEMVIMCYARHNAMPLRALHDYSGDISRVPLTIQLPKIGHWYIAIHVVNLTKVEGTVQEEYMKSNLCFSLEWQIHECPLGRAGPNCTWERHMLQRVVKRGSGSYYLPIGQKMQSANFPLVPLLSKFSFDEKSVAWTYFLLDIPHGAAGANLLIQLTSDEKVDIGIYARFGGLPSLETWDHYVNRTDSSNGSMFLASHESSERILGFYILYAREGIWSFGFRHPALSVSRGEITMSVAHVGCPRRCSSHGKCLSELDQSGVAAYSFCSCDRIYGGFDCSIQLVTNEEFLKINVGHVWHSIALIASNAAAILPAFWALQKKAFSEWVLFTSSGVSSGLYHSCRVNIWCALPFHVLQFMDFWLSFMAVVSTIIYMANIDEVSKRAIQTTVAIFTALIAESGATRSVNIILVVAIGILGLLVGWLIEFSATIRSVYSSGFHLNIQERWQNIRRWPWKIMKTLHQLFRWRYIFLGFVALSAAAVSWKMESNQNYWIWHSLWHVTIYTSCFLFLCSTSMTNNSQRFPAAEYESTRENSSSRGEIIEGANSTLENGGRDTV